MPPTGRAGASCSRTGRASRSRSLGLPRWGWPAPSVLAGATSPSGCAELALERLDQRVDLEQLERLQLRASAGAERERDLRDRRSVGRLDDIDEVVLADRRPLVQHGGSELLDVPVDLAQPGRI